MEDRFDTDVDDVWSALTDPAVWLAGWARSRATYDSRCGEFRARFLVSGWEGAGCVEACEPPRRLLLTMRDADPQPGQPAEGDIEVTLAADGDQTILVWEERDKPLGCSLPTGAGSQLHVEDLGDHLARRERRDDAKARWDELHPAYQGLAADLS